MSKENEKVYSPEEHYEAASLELAIYRSLKRDHDAVRAAMNEDDENELLRIAEEEMPRMLCFINQHTKRMAVRSNLRKHGRQILQIAAVVILILSIGFSAAVATSRNVRAKFVRFLSFLENGEEIVIPEEWEGRYYPTYIPQGYFIQLCSSSGAGLNLVKYVNVEGSTLTIEVCDINSFGRINTENSEIHYITLHGVKATVLRQPCGDICIIWSLSDCCFDVTGDNYETTLAVAQSIGAIQKK